MTTHADAATARAFLQANGRLLDLRLCDVVCDGDEPDRVVAALDGYRNADGGFGCGLEPDTRSPFSQPLYVEIALGYLVAAGANAADRVTAAFDWLDTIADDDGAVPTVLATIAGYPMADHWQNATYVPSVNPTAAIAAHGHSLGATHPWLDRATAYCFEQVRTGQAPNEAHALLALSKLVAAVPDHEAGAEAAERIQSLLPSAAFMKLDPSDPGYGVTPLEFAPRPDHPVRGWFDDAIIEGHLDGLVQDQCEDGGWPVVWNTASAMTYWEWRGIRTLQALMVLTAYGRM